MPAASLAAYAATGDMVEIPLIRCSRSRNEGPTNPITATRMKSGVMLLDLARKMSRNTYEQARFRCVLGDTDGFPGGIWIVAEGREQEDLGAPLLIQIPTDDGTLRPVVIRVPSSGLSLGHGRGDARDLFPLLRLYAMHDLTGRYRRSSTSEADEQRALATARAAYPTYQQTVRDLLDEAAGTRPPLSDVTLLRLAATSLGLSTSVPEPRWRASGIYARRIPALTNLVVAGFTPDEADYWTCDPPLANADEFVPARIGSREVTYGHAALFRHWVNWRAVDLPAMDDDTLADWFVHVGTPSDGRTPEDMWREVVLFVQAGAPDLTTLDLLRMRTGGNHGLWTRAAGDSVRACWAVLLGFSRAEVADLREAGTLDATLATMAGLRDTTSYLRGDYSDPVAQAFITRHPLATPATG